MTEEFNSQNRAEIEKQRTLSDAEFLKGGAEYAVDQAGEVRLEVTEKQLEELKSQMEWERRNLRVARYFSVLEEEMELVRKNGTEEDIKAFQHRVNSDRARVEDAVLEDSEWKVTFNYESLRAAKREMIHDRLDNHFPSLMGIREFKYDTGRGEPNCMGCKVGRPPVDEDELNMDRGGVKDFWTDFINAFIQDTGLSAEDFYTIINEMSGPGRRRVDECGFPTRFKEYIDANLIPKEQN